NNPSLPTTRRYQELLANKGIDCLIAAVPYHWHKQIVVDAVSAGKDMYCEKPMSHTGAEGVEMADAARKTGRIVQIGSQRVSSVICAKAKDLVAKGALGDLMLVEGSLGRNDPTGAWEYPPPLDLSPQTLDWDTWQGAVPKRAFDPLLFARWRCWKEYGTGVAGDLLVHLVSGMMYVLGINEPPKRTMAMGGIPCREKNRLSRVSPTAAIHGTTKNRTCGISSRRCAAASRWWKTLSSVTTPRWPATWPMNPTSEGVPCTGTQRRRALKHS